jgi:hypothetical protein
LNTVLDKNSPTFKELKEKPQFFLKKTAKKTVRSSKGTQKSERNIKEN